MSPLMHENRRNAESLFMELPDVLGALSHPVTPHYNPQEEAGPFLQISVFKKRQGKGPWQLGTEAHMYTLAPPACRNPLNITRALSLLQKGKCQNPKLVGFLAS